MATVPFHTHEFTIPTATEQEIRDGVSTKVVSPDQLLPVLNDLAGNLGTASQFDVGTAAGNVVQLLTGGKLPAVDGSNLTNLPGGGAGTGDVTGPAASVSGNLASFSGTSGKVIQDSLLSLDTNTSLTANSDTKIPSQKAVKTYVDGIVAAQDAMVFKGVIDCSANPNYPAADRGWTYRVSVAGKIGGASGVVVQVGDMAICLTDGTVTGNQASVGASWNVIQANIDGALLTTDIGVTVQGFDANTAKLNSAQTWTGAQKFGRMTLTPLAVSVLAIDCSANNYFTKTIATTSTFTVSNVPTSQDYAFTLKLTYTSGTITWFSGVNWVNGTTPTLTGGKVYLMMFQTDDGGTTFRAASMEFAA